MESFETIFMFTCKQWGHCVNLLSFAIIIEFMVTALLFGLAIAVSDQEYVSLAHRHVFSMLAWTLVLVALCLVTVTLLSAKAAMKGLRDVESILRHLQKLDQENVEQEEDDDNTTQDLIPSHIV